MRWKIYYSDGSVSNNDATAASITKRMDVQVIVQDNNDNGWVTLSGHDYYVFDDRGGGPRWFGVDIFGLHHYLLQPGSKYVLFGTMIDNRRFDEIFNMARNDNDFRDKTGYLSRERKPQD